jgi:uncharacterized SAM-binding protein YcdF (DUF218 family)
MFAVFNRKPAPLLERAAKAALVLTVLIGGGGAWQHLATERIAARAEQARLAQIQMTTKKWQALQREAGIQAAAQAYAEKWHAEKSQAPDSANAPVNTPGI